jgi:hypothetical protein
VNSASGGRVPRTALQISLTSDSHREAGTSVYAAWHAMLHRADRFVRLDLAQLATTAITSDEYIDRYAHGWAQWWMDLGSPCPCPRPPGTLFWCGQATAWCRSGG